MDGKYTNKSPPKPPRCHSCARPMQLLRKTSRFGGLPDLYSFYCLACDEWHVEEGGPIKFTELQPEQRQPEADHPRYQANREKARVHNWSYSMSPTIAECLEHARQCEWYAARTNDEQDRKFLIRKAKDWTKLAIKKELEIRASARAAA